MADHLQDNHCRKLSSRARSASDDMKIDSAEDIHQDGDDAVINGDDGH